MAGSQEMTTETTETTDLNTYRMALYGRANSGKTCILAALAMSRTPSARQSSCHRVPVEEARPEGDPATWREDDPVAQRYWGKDWIDEAIERLERHQVPPANPTASGHLTVVYDFMAPGRGRMRIELIDYSGELIDPNLSHEQLAANLRDRLASMDGLLVVGEVPRPHQPSPESYTELRKLQEAFGLLLSQQGHGAEADFPIALLVSKWDRLGPMNHADPDAEEVRLAQYLASDPPPALRHLHDALRDAVTAGSFRAWPVSALGACALHNGSGRTIERPKQINPLRSFGLEDSFVWAAQQRNAIDIRTFPEAVEKLSPWRFGLPFKSHPVRQQCRRLLARLSEENTELPAIRSALEQCQRILRARTIFTFATALLLVLFCEAGLDSLRYSTVSQVVEDPTLASAAEVGAAREWLADYRSAPIFRHLLMRPFLGSTRIDSALATLDAPKISDNEEALKRLEMDSEALAQMTLADAEELKSRAQQWPPHEVLVEPQRRERHNRLLSVLEQHITMRRNELARQRNEAELARLKTASSPEGISLDKLRSLRDEAESWPPEPELASEAQIARHTTLLSELAYRIEIAEGILADQHLEEDYNDLMSAGSLNEAASILSSYARESAKKIELREDFKSRVLGLAREEISRSIEDGQWSEAYRQLDSLEALPGELQPAALRQEVSRQRQRVEQSHDRALYEEVRQAKTQAALARYRDNAPLQEMSGPVGRYLTYLEKIANPIPLTLHLTGIRWASDCEWETDNQILVTVQGRDAIQTEDISSRYCKPLGYVGSYQFQAQTKERVSVHMQIIDKDMVFDDRDQGQNDKSLTPEQWDGYTLQLPDFKGRINRATFQLDGIPSEPVLPSWGEP